MVRVGTSDLGARTKPLTLPTLEAAASTPGGGQAVTIASEAIVIAAGRFPIIELSQKLLRFGWWIGYTGRL
jgi:bacteriorhodopsin